MTKRKRKKAERTAASSRKKGELVERVVTMTQEGEPQIVVRRDVRLPAKHSDKRSRQIDVLLEGHFAGYPTMHAIECKNFRRPVDVGDIGRFRDLLEDVGLSPQQGVLVSASGIGSGALDRALLVLPQHLVVYVPVVHPVASLASGVGPSPSACHDPAERSG